VLTAAVESSVTAKADAVAAELRAACIALADPDPLTLFDNVYSEPHAVLARQRDEYSRYLRTFVGVDSDNADADRPDNAAPEMRVDGAER